MNLPKECFVVGHETDNGTISVDILLGGSYFIRTRAGERRPSNLDYIVRYSNYADALMEARRLELEGIEGYRPKDGKTKWEVYRMKLEIVPTPVIERV